MSHISKHRDASSFLGEFTGLDLTLIFLPSSAESLCYWKTTGYAGRFSSWNRFCYLPRKKLQWCVHKHRDLPSVFLCRQSLCPLNPEEITSVNWAGFILTTDQFDELMKARAKHWTDRPFSWPSNTVVNKPCVKRPSTQTKHSQHWWCSLYILFRRWNSDILDVSYKQV